jgi:hypothetical protein
MNFYFWTLENLPMTIATHRKLSVEYYSALYFINDLPEDLIRYTILPYLLPPKYRVIHKQFFGMVLRELTKLFDWYWPGRPPLKSIKKRKGRPRKLRVLPLKIHLYKRGRRNI